MSAFVSDKKRNALQHRLSSLNIKEDDLLESFVRGSGKGGQKKNKTSNCVILQYPPLNISIRCEENRSREVNRYLARQLLCEEVELITTGQNSKTREADKLKKQKKRRERRQKQTTENTSKEDAV